MNDFTIKTPTIRVPGLLSDDAMQEQLKIFKQSGLNGGATPIPDGAVELADRVNGEFFDAPVRAAIKAAAPLAGPVAPLLRMGADIKADSIPSLRKPVDEQQQAIDTRSDVLSSPGFDTAFQLLFGVTAPKGGYLDTLGTLTPEESATLQQQRVEEAKQYEQTVQRHIETRKQLRDLTDDQAAAMGFPVQPGMNDQGQKDLAAKADAEQLKIATENVKAQQLEAPKKAWWLDAINSFDRSFNEGFTSIGKSAAIGLWELPGEITGIRNSGRSDVRAWFDTVDATMNKMIPPDKARDQDFLNLLAGGGGSMTSFLAAGLIAKTLGLPVEASTLITGAATQASVQYEDAEAHDGTELERLIAFFAGAGLGATEGLPVNRMLARAEQATGGLVSRTLRHSASGSLEEFVQELGQNIGQDVVAKWLYDEQRKLNWGSYLKAAAVGGILGGMGGMASSTLERSGIIPARDNAEAAAERQTDEGRAKREQFEVRQQEVLTKVISTAQEQFDSLTNAQDKVLPPNEHEQLAADVVTPETGVTNADLQDDTKALTEEQKRQAEPAAPVIVQDDSGTAVDATALDKGLDDIDIAANASAAEASAATAEVSATNADVAARSADVSAAAAAQSLKLVRSEVANDVPPEERPPGQPFQYDIQNAEGSSVGEAWGSVDGNTLHLSGIREHSDKPNSFGTGAVRGLLRQFRQEYPDVKIVKADRISGARTNGKFDPRNGVDVEALLASTSSSRGSYNAEPKRAAGGVTGQASPAGDNVSLKQIADNFTKLLGLTVRQGRFTLKGADVMGQFSARSGVIRMRTPNDISTLIHEGGHALETNADGELKAFVTRNTVMLQTIARKLYGGDTSKMTDAAKRSEGFAEFFRVYVTNKRFAEINYPTITAEFDTLLDKNPQLRDGLKLIGDQYAAWLQMPSTQLLANMIQSGKETVGINAAIEEMRKEGLGNWFREVVNGLHTATLNKFNNLNILVADVLNAAPSVIDLKRADDPRVLIRLAANSGQRAMVQLTDGVMGHKSVDPSTPGLRDVLLRYHGLAPNAQLQAINPVKQRDFAAYVVALRGIDEYSRFSQGIIERPPVAATLGDLTTAVNELEAKYGDDFKEAAQMIHKFSMGLWKKSYDAGLLDDQTYEDGNNRAFYVPLQRDMSDKAMTQGGISASQASQGKSIVKRFRGSDRDIIDPVDALMQKTFALEKVIAENEVKVALAKLADKAGTVGALVERIPAHRLLGEQYSIQEIARQLTKDPTMTQTDAADLMSLLEAAIDDGNRIALFRSQQAQAAGENIVFFWENGKLAALQLKDGDIGADVLNVLNSVGTENVPFLVDLIAYPSTVFRAAVTSWPDFLLVNFIRDQMSAFVLTEGYTPFVTGLRGVADEIRQHDWARQYNAAMGTMGGMNSSTLHQARVERDVSALRKKGYIAQVFRDRSIGGAVRGLARVTELTETGTRLGIFRQAYKRAAADGLTPWEASVEASYISTDYIDFSLHGNRMLAWRRLIPFLNAQLQGLNKMVRTLAGDEVRQRHGLMFAVSAFFKDTRNLPLSRTERAAVRTGRKAWLKMSALGLIGAALQAVFEDDPDYQDASEYLRTTGWVIPIGNGHIVYVPKPFELAMVSNFFERGLEMAGGDKEAKNRLLRGMAMNLLPPTNPPAIQTMVEQLANWESFSGREIVPDYMRALEPELQYNHYTSEFAKSLGSIMGWSPMRIDHVMNSFGASAYRDLTQLYNMTDPTRPSSDVTDWPMTRRFVRDARRGATSAQDFWKYASTVTGSLRRAELTYKNYIESGREAAAENYLSELSPDERAYAVLNTHFKAEYKKLNPTYRVAQLNTVISTMRRELYSDLGVDNTGPGGETYPLLLSAKEKADVDTIMSELARREMRDALIYMKAPGWANKKPLPTEPTIELLRATNPDMAEEFERRVHKAKIYDAQTVQEYWPEVRDRLLQDGDGAFLKDIVAVAKAMR